MIHDGSYSPRSLLLVLLGVLHCMILFFFILSIFCYYDNARQLVQVGDYKTFECFDKHQKSNWRLGFYVFKLLVFSPLMITSCLPWPWISKMNNDRNAHCLSKHFGECTYHTYVIYYNGYIPRWLHTINVKPLPP
jgi:hypothetical protein